MFRLEAAQRSCPTFALPPFTMAQKKRGTVSQALLQKGSLKIVLFISFRTVHCVPKSLAILWALGLLVCPYRLGLLTVHPSRVINKSLV